MGEGKLVFYRSGERLPIFVRSRGTRASTQRKSYGDQARRIVLIGQELRESTNLQFLPAGHLGNAAAIANNPIDRHAAGRDICVLDAFTNRHHKDSGASRWWGGRNRPLCLALVIRASGAADDEK
jgi:hypothetical protein